MIRGRLTREALLGKCAGMLTDGTFSREERRQHRVVLQILELRLHLLASFPRDARLVSVWKTGRLLPPHDFCQAGHERTRLMDHPDKCHLVEIDENARNPIDVVFRAAHWPLDDPDMQRGC